jgi:hypothetical protein
MKHVWLFVPGVCAFAPLMFGQTGVPVLKSEVKSAFVWREDSPSGAVSSTLQDPLTGNAMHTLSYAGIEVSSRIGFERVGTSEVGIFLNYQTIIVNSTDAALYCDTAESALTATWRHVSGLCPRARNSVRRNVKANQTRWSSGECTVWRAASFPATTSFRRTPHLKLLLSYLEVPLRFHP